GTHAGERGAGAAVRAFVRTAWAWLLVLAYFAWRGYLLGRWVGGYGAGAADPRSAGFWMQRGEQLLTALSPVHLGVFPVAVKAVCLGFVAAALILACVRGARSGAGRRWLAVAAAWFVCFVFPGLFLTVDGAELTNGRLLYVQSAGTAGLVACGIAAIGSRWGRRVAAAAGIALYAVLLAGNLRPWREAAAQADELHAQIEGIARAVPPDRDVVVADLPFVQRGAFVATGAIALPPFLVVPRTTPVLAFLASEHELTLHALAARSGEVAVWRFDPGANELEPQHLALPRPLALAGGGSVLAARSRWQDASSLSVDALIAAGTEDGLVVRVTDGEGHELDRAALAALPGSAGAVRRAVLRVPGPRPAVLRTEIADGGGWRLVDEVRAPRRQ
ncbi:MAG TPA: hypothetical protein VK081_01620, partial [Planctomycetota bacterium]|nr:hypothetical protein [Planctomycetota bacterium]